MKYQRVLVLVVALAVGSTFVLSGSAHASSKKPNILVIWGDDIGGFNISANNRA